MAMTRREARTVIGAGAALVIALLVLLFLRHGYQTVDTGAGQKKAIEALDHAQSVDVLRLANEIFPGMEDSMPSGTVSFRGYQVSGAKRVKEPQRITLALKDGFTKDSSVRTCFAPHHAVRVTTETQVFDYLVSYHCQQTVVFLGKDKIATIPTRDVQAELEEAYNRSGL
jgi:hypothetical protein